MQHNIIVVVVDMTVDIACVYSHWYDRGSDPDRAARGWYLCHQHHHVCLCQEEAEQLKTCPSEQC